MSLLDGDLVEYVKVTIAGSKGDYGGVVFKDDSGGFGTTFEGLKQETHSPFKERILLDSVIFIPLVQFLQIWHKEAFTNFKSLEVKNP